KNWGLPTLSQGALIAPSNRTPLRRRVDRAGCPHFFAPSTQPGVFITIVMRNAIATLVRAASRLISTQASTRLAADDDDLETIRNRLRAALLAVFIRSGRAHFGGRKIQLVRFLIRGDGAGATRRRDGGRDLEFLVDHSDGAVASVGREGVAVVEGHSVHSGTDGRRGQHFAGGGI